MAKVSFARKGKRLRIWEREGPPVHRGEAWGGSGIHLGYMLNSCFGLS